LLLQVSCRNNKQDDGEGMQTFKVKLQNVENGSILCQKDGASFTQLDKVPKGTKLHFILRAVEGWVPTLLSIGDVNFGEVSKDGTIEGYAVITKDIEVKGVCSNSFVKINIKNVENGAISVKKEDGTPFTSFGKVKIGTELIFTLEAEDEYIPEKLTIDGKDITTFTQEGTIEEKVKIVKEIEVSGSCKVRDKHFTITVTQPEHGEIFCKDDGGKTFTDFANVEDGKELTFVLVSKNKNYIPKFLQIGSTKNEIINAQNAIIETITVKSNLDVKGELVERFFKIDIKNVVHGKILCQDESGEELSDLSSIEYGSLLLFKLIPNTSYVAEKLVIDGSEYTEATQEGFIEKKVKVEKAFEVSGLCKKSDGIFKLTFIVEPSDKGELTCKKEDGTAFTNINTVPEGTKLIFVLKAKDANSLPSTLTVGSTDYTHLNSKNEIESDVVIIKNNLTIRGVIEDNPNYFKIDIKKVENGIIRCQNQDGSAFTSFDKVKEGTNLTFTLVPNDKYIASSLVVGNKTYNEPTVDGFIISEPTIVNTSFEVSGVCKKKIEYFEVTISPLANGKITCKKVDGNPIENLKKIESGTELLFSLESLDKTKWKPKKLIIGDKEYTTLKEDRIEVKLKISDNLICAGEMEKILETFKVKVLPVENGLITCKKEGENALFTDFDNVLEGSVLIFTLSASDKNTHKPSYLTIDKEKFSALNAEGNIEGRLEVLKNNIEVKGECVIKESDKKWKVKVTQPNVGGTITCTKNDGGALDLDAVPDGTTIKVTFQASIDHHVKFLKIGDNTIEANDDNKKIEKEWLVQQNLEIKGECVPFYVVSVKDVPNGKIISKTSDGHEITSDELLEVEDGEILIFELKALDPSQYTPEFLKINDATYTDVVDGSITSNEITVEGNISVEGSVAKSEIALKEVVLENEFLEKDAMTKNENAIKEAGAEHVLVFPAVPTYIESLEVLIKTSPVGAKVKYTPDLQDGKWVLVNGENTLTIDIGDANKITYTLKINRVDIELKELSFMQHNISTGKEKRIKFSPGNYKTNQHFTIVEDTDGSKYLTFALKEGAYECQDDDFDPPKPLYLYKATLKTTPPKEISGHFFLNVKHPKTEAWDSMPPINIEKNDYSDADPFFDDSWHPNIVLDENGMGMWIPTHVFAADFEILNNEVDLYEINLVFQDVTGNIEEDLNGKNLNLIKFGDHDDATHPFKKLKNLEISNKATKVLVHVLLEQAAAKVTSISWKGSINRPQGDGATGFYRYFTFTNTNIETKTLEIRYVSANGKKKKSKTIKISRSDKAYNANVTSIKVCGVEAVLVDGNYEVTIPKGANHVGKVEVTCEDATCKYVVKTYLEQADGSWEIGKDITKKDDVDFSKKENQELGIDAFPLIGFLYNKFYSVTVKVEK